MREPAFLILAVLAQEDLHGYGIVKKVESLSDGEVHLALGTLYGALDRLGEKGLVEVAREERQGKRLRRYYRLTDFGATALRQEIERQSRVTDVARSNLEARRSTGPKVLEALTPIDAHRLEAVHAAL